jgi:hypothetical protein
VEAGEINTVVPAGASGSGDRIVDRRHFLLTSLAGPVAAPLAAPAQQPPGKTARIGFLFFVTSPFLDEEFRQGLHELGYVEGRNIAIEYRSAEGKYERLPGLAAELARLKVEVDVIVTASPPATDAAKQATSTIPIIFAVSGDPVAAGLVASLARPGGNITGLASIAVPVTNPLRGRAWPLTWCLRVGWYLRVGRAGAPGRPREERLRLGKARDAARMRANAPLSFR